MGNLKLWFWSKVAPQEWKAWSWWEALDKYSVIYGSAERSSFCDGVSRSVTRTQFIYWSPLSLLVALADLFIQMKRQTGKKKGFYIAASWQKPVTVCNTWNAFSHAHFFPTCHDKHFLFFVHGERPCEKREREAKKYVREEQAKQKRRQTAAGSGGGRSNQGSPTQAPSCLLAHKVPQDFPWTMMFAENIVARAGCSVCGESSIYTCQKPNYFHGNEKWLEKRLPLDSQWPDLHRLDVTCQNPGMPTFKNMRQSNKYDLKKKKRGIKEKQGLVWG